jgi:hypothetical protein
MASLPHNFRYEGTYGSFQKTLGKDHEARYCSAQTILDVLNSPNPRLRNPVGKCQYIFIVQDSTTIFRTIMEKNKCDKCNLTIHPNFIGNHKCDHQNCPICKSPITPSEYWFHVRSHPGHENDSPPPPKVSTFENRRNASHSGYGNYRRNY